MIESHRSTGRIPDHRRFERHLAVFDLDEKQKSELVAALYALALEVIESRPEPVDNSTEGALTRAFVAANAVEWN